MQDSQIKDGLSVPGITEVSKLIEEDESLDAEVKEFDGHNSRPSLFLLVFLLEVDFLWLFTFLLS